MSGALSNSSTRDFSLELSHNRPAAETEDQLSARLDAERYEWRLRDYTRFSSEDQLERYASAIKGGDSHWFDADTKRFFSSRTGLVLHGESPANWNLFITSERYSTRTKRRYSIRQLLIDGKIITIGEFQAYGSRASAIAAARRYLAAQEGEYSHA